MSGTPASAPDGVDDGPDRDGGAVVPGKRRSNFSSLSNRVCTAL